MSKRSESESVLVAAAIAFDAELAEYARLAELLLRTPLGGLKQLERANLTIEEISGTEGRLGATGRALAQAIGEARDRQQQLADQMVAHLPLVHQRNEALRTVVTELKQLGEAMRELNTAASSGAALHEVEERVTALATAAEALAVRARAEEFEEPASQAHAMHQQMLALAKKLHSITSKQS